MARNIGEEQAADATGSTTRDVVDIAATLSLAERLAIDPDIKTGQFDSTGSELAASPDLHALHVLCGGIRHGSIIPAEGAMSFAHWWLAWHPGICPTFKPRRFVDWPSGAT